MLSTFDLKNIIVTGWPILSVLLVFSVLVVSIAWECRALFVWIRQAGPETDKQPMFDRVEQRLAILGTIANAAPFVGLLGTVIGIIRAFHTISQASGSGGGMTLVAGGISEALVSTAAGLVVAIPASMIFNYCTFQNEKLMERSDEKP